MTEADQYAIWKRERDGPIDQNWLRVKLGANLPLISSVIKRHT